MDPRSMNDLQHDSKEYRHRNQGYNHLGETNGMNNINKVIKDTFQVVLDIYTLAQGYKCICELMLMR
jgi:hypothetical protein